MENEELLNDYKKFLKKKNLSNNTITAYEGSVRLFFSMNKEITPENLQRYKTYLITHYRPATVNQRIHAMNHYSRFLAETNGEEYIFIASYHLPSVKVQQKTFMDSVISNEDYELLKEKLKEEKKDEILKMKYLNNSYRML